MVNAAFYILYVLWLCVYSFYLRISFFFLTLFLYLLFVFFLTKVHCNYNKSIWLLESSLWWQPKSQASGIGQQHFVTLVLPSALTLGFLNHIPFTTYMISTLMLSIILGKWTALSVFLDAQDVNTSLPESLLTSCKHMISLLLKCV